MTRDDLFALAKKFGWQRGKPLTEQQRTRIENQLGAALTQEKVDEAPRVFDVPGGRRTTKTEAVAALMEELR